MDSLSITVATHRNQHVIVNGLSPADPRGYLRLGQMVVPCALGKAGRRAIKREGDGATPMGRFRLLGVLYRPDKVGRPATRLPIRAIRPSWGWCDDSSDRNYNREVTLPYPASHERLWRDDGLYDLVVVLDYNVSVRKRRAGSAIFMHVARPRYLPTEGCVALAAVDLARLLARLRPGATITIL